MARQATTPVEFNRTVRRDTAVTMTSGRAAKVVPLTYIPLLPGDSGAGSVGIDIELAEMPRPLLNGVMANLQAWFVPKLAHPQFVGPDDFMHAFHGTPIKSYGAADRTPPNFYTTVSGAALTSFQDSDFAKTLGIHTGAIPSHMDLVDAFWLIYNFRLAAHSSRLTRAPYYTEDPVEALKLPRAFWPSGRFSKVVPDYERALIVGSLDLDVAAGQIPVSGVGISNPAGYAAATITDFRDTANGIQSSVEGWVDRETVDQAGRARAAFKRNPGTALPAIFAEMGGETVSVTLADIDKARTTQAFAKLRLAYAGNDSTGFDNDDVLVAHLMQGLSVPPESFKRPMLLDSKRVPFGFAERFATDAANLDQSVSQGRASATLSLNVPQNQYGGVVIVTCEVLPERLDERQSDEWLHTTTTDGLPNALRDVQRPEPVDLVLNRRLDARHATPGGLYGYEPMNDKWNRAATRLGGIFYQANPAAPTIESRAGIWMSSIINPTFTADHWLCPANFPHNVFSNTTGPAFEVVARHNMAISGLTQIGDVLAENNDDYDAVIAAGA